MPDYVESSNGSLIARIDNGNAYTDRRFLVTHDGGGAGDQLFEVNEDGKVTLYGELWRDATVQMNNNQAGDVVEFLSNGASVAKINSAGIGDFHAAGVKLLILSTTGDPGSTGDVALYDIGGALILHVYDGAAWQAISH